jgi:hypothetical protein
VSLTGIALRDFIVINFPLFLATWVIGFVVSWRWISRDEREASMVKDYKGTMMGLSPIVIIVALTLLEVPVWLAVMVGVFIVIILKRVSVRRSLTFLSKGIKWDIVAAVFATLFFRYMLVASGSVTSLLRSILATGVPLMLLLLVIPILVGTISANPTMGIGIVFPLLIPLIAKMNVNILTIIYAGLVAGYNGSPMHLCLILTNQYYRSDMSKVYRYLLPSIVLLFVVMVIYHVILGGLLTTDLTSLV